MKLGLSIILVLSLISCSKESVQKGIQGEWYFTRVVVTYNDGSPYITTDYSWSDVKYTNTENTIYVMDNPKSYQMVGSDSILITENNRMAGVEFLSPKKDGFDLIVVGDDGDQTIQHLKCSYRKKK